MFALRQTYRTLNETVRVLEAEFVVANDATYTSQLHEIADCTSKHTSIIPGQTTEVNLL